jgi:hypothetical protein
LIWTLITSIVIIIWLEWTRFLLVKPKTSMTSCAKNYFSSFKTMFYLHLISDGVMENNTSNKHIDFYLKTWIMHPDRSASKILEIQVLKTNMQNFMCPFIVMLLICQCSVNIFWMIHINKLLNVLCKPFFNAPQSSMMVFNKFSHLNVWMMSNHNS